MARGSRQPLQQSLKPQTDKGHGGEVGRSERPGSLRGGQRRESRGSLRGRLAAEPALECGRPDRVPVDSPFRRRRL